MRSSPTPSVGTHSIPVKIRQAKESDKSQVLEFCRDTWRGGDYIPDVWDEWVKDKKGRLIVATISGRPVGLAHAALQTRNVAWLEGVRVHPSFRGRGIAGRLNIVLTGFAARKGARIARLCTGSMNKASRKHLDKIGFPLLKRFQRLDCVRPLKSSPTGIVRPHKYYPRMWQWIKSSQEFRQFMAMYSDGWTWHPLTISAFRRFLSQRGVLLSGSIVPTAMSLFSNEERRLTIGFTAGRPEDIRNHARYLRHLLLKGVCEKVRVLLPERSKLIDQFEDAAYEKSGRILVYEKALSPQARSKRSKAQGSDNGVRP